MAYSLLSHGLYSYTNVRDFRASGHLCFTLGGSAQIMFPNVLSSSQRSHSPSGDRASYGTFEHLLHLTTRQSERSQNCLLDQNVDIWENHRCKSSYATADVQLLGTEEGVCQLGKVVHNNKYI